MTQPVVLTQHVSAPAAAVYAAWTSADLLATWWWPHLPDTTYEVDARVGGFYRIRSDAAGIGARGRFTELDPPRRIAMTWVWETGDESSPEDAVTVELDEQEDGTFVTVTHVVVTPGEDTSGLRQGWSDVLARLGLLRRAAASAHG
jgi:uncharacterized protein YndB with AHSA1/START domain